jgi:hypothetical protein
MMNPAPNHNHQEPTEGGCEICGFKKPDFRNYEDLYIIYPRIAESDGSRPSQLDVFYQPFHQQEWTREYHARSVLNMEDASPERLQWKLKRFFPEARNSGKYLCWISRIIGNSCWTDSRVLGSEER